MEAQTITPPSILPLRLWGLVALVLGLGALFAPGSGPDVQFAGFVVLSMGAAALWTRSYPPAPAWSVMKFTLPLAFVALATSGF